MSFRVDESMYFLELLGASGALRRLSLQDEPSKNSVMRRQERSFQHQSVVWRRRDATCFFKVAFASTKQALARTFFEK